MTEKKTGWTPGPWSHAPVYRPPIGFTEQEVDANGNVFWGYSITGSNERGGGILPTLAAVHNFPDNIEANAHLIAAAPEMDEVLGDVLPLLDEIAEKQGLSYSEAQGLAAEVRRVRAKARGEQS